MSILTKLAAEAYDRAAFAAFGTQSEFSLANAKALMWLAQLSYETDEPRKVVNILEMFGAKLLPGGIVTAPAPASLPMARTEAIVVDRADATLVAFAGTDPVVLADWVADFDIRPHLGTTQGFFLALRDAMPMIRTLVVGAHKPVFVTGHSLGGALAVLAAQDLAMNGATVKAVYTYGMPRPGDAAFGATYDARLGPVTYRLVHGEDIVPTVAPSFLGFRHVGRFLSCKSALHFDVGNLAATPGSDEPLFFKGFGQSLAERIQTIFGKGANTDGPSADALLGPDWAGRPDFVKALIRAQSPSIHDHLPDSYICVLR
jgi:triacylglycerol lipase